MRSRYEPIKEVVPAFTRPNIFHNLLMTCLAHPLTHDSDIDDPRSSVQCSFPAPTRRRGNAWPRLAILEPLACLQRLLRQRPSGENGIEEYKQRDSCRCESKDDRSGK